MLLSQCDFFLQNLRSQEERNGQLISGTQLGFRNCPLQLAVTVVNRFNYLLHLQVLDCQLMEGHIVHFVLALTSAVDVASSKRNHESNNL